MAVAGMPTSRTDVDLAGDHRTYWSADDGSIHFLVRDGSLSSVIVATHAGDAAAVHVHADRLLDDLAPTATREEVRALRGEPERTSDGPQEVADQFAVDGSFQHCILVDGRLARLTLMRDDPAEW